MFKEIESKHHIVDRETELVGQIRGLEEKIEAIQQPRSDYALEHFVVGQHAMPERQYAQALLELQVKMVNIERTSVNIERISIEIEMLELEIKACNGDAKTTRLKQNDIRTKELDLYEITLARLGAVREAESLYGIVQKIEMVAGEMSYERIQSAELDYWRVRLEEQASRELRSVGTVCAGNLEAIQQMQRVIGVPEKPKILDGDFQALPNIFVEKQVRSVDSVVTEAPVLGSGINNGCCL